MSVNKVILVGNVGNDPEVRYLDSGVPVANFRLATSENYTNKNGEKVSQTEWHNIVLWRGLAEVTEKYVKKGMQLYIEGQLRTRSWDDKDGNKRYITEVVANTMQMLGKKGDSHSTPSEAPAAESNTQAQENTDAAAADDDLPF